MTYQTRDYENYLKKVNAFNQLSWIQNHLHLMEKPNFWSILEYGENSKSSHEVRTSRMLRWLLDANETHQLGNIFAHKLVSLLNGDYKYDASKNEAIQVTAEEQRIDVLYKDFSQNIIIAIEVKQYAEEGIEDGVSQLDRYEEIVHEMINNTDEAIHPYYIYLTPLKEAPSNKNWYPVSYGELNNIIDEIYAQYMLNSKNKYIEDTKKIVMDFKDDLQRSIDYLEKNRNDINKKLTKKEKELTKLLAHEIQHETDSKHINRLMEINTDKELKLKDLILIIEGSIYAQNHATNVGVQILMRKIYNYFSKEEKLETNPDKLMKYKTNETLEPIAQSLIETYDLPCDKIVLTRGDGQGLYLFDRDNKHRVYLSGDSVGLFPNDGVQLLTIGPKPKVVAKSPTINKERFQVDYNLILNDKIKSRDGRLISIDKLIEDYIIPQLIQISNQKLSYQEIT